MNVIKPTKEYYDEYPLIYFDEMCDEEWPNGAWACGVPAEDTFYGATPNEALAAWELEMRKTK